MAEVRYVSASRVYSKDAKPAVNGLDLDIKDGEFMVLVGPSGSGKTTALRMLAGLEPLDGGRVEIGNRDVTWVPPKDRDIAMVFQNYALYPQKTVAQNMGFALKMQRVPRDERAAGCGRPPSCWTWMTSCLTASPRPCPGVSGSGWRWGGPSSASPRSS